MTPPWYVFTGGPCSGKTTLLEAFRERGYAVSPEPGRIYFEAKFAEGKTIEELLADMPKLEHEILMQHVQLESAFRKDVTLFLDRGIPDCLGYYRVYNVPEDEVLHEAMKKAEYRRVFLLDPIDAYVNDNVRVESSELASRIHESIRAAYLELGFDLIEVPVMPIPERVEFVLSRLE